MILVRNSCFALSAMMASCHNRYRADNIAKTIAQSSSANVLAISGD